MLQTAMTAGAAVYLTACGGSGGSAAADKASTPGGASAKPTTKPDRLVVRNWGDPYSTTWGKTAGASFEAQTGIPVDWDTTDSSAIMTKIQTAIRAGQRPPVDAVVSFATDGHLAHVQKLSRPLDPKLVPNLAHLNQKVAHPDGLNDWAYLALYSYGAPFIYRTDKMKAPTSWNDLWASTLRGHIQMGTTFPWILFPLARMLNIDVAKDDVKPVWDKIASLRSNIAGVGDDTDFIKGITSGDYWIGSQLPGDAKTAKENGAPVAMAIPREGMTVNRDVYFVLNGTPDATAYYAQVFADHLVGKAAQQIVTERLNVVPVNLEVKLPKVMRNNPVFPFTEQEIAKVGVIPPTALVAEHNAEWQAAYNRAVKG